MRSFWISLLVFVLLMCSCRTKKIDSNARVRGDVRSELALLNESVKIDTSKTVYYVNGTQRIVIEEDIIETEYDKESGKAAKETKTKRRIVQDSDEVVSAEEEREVFEVSVDSTEHFLDVTEMMDAEVKKESDGGQDDFGKWAWIVAGYLVCAFLIYLFVKLKSRVN